MEEDVPTFPPSSAHTQGAGPSDPAVATGLSPRPNPAAPGCRGSWTFSRDEAQPPHSRLGEGLVSTCGLPGSQVTKTDKWRFLKEFHSETTLYNLLKSEGLSRWNYKSSHLPSFVRALADSFIYPAGASCAPPRATAVLGTGCTEMSKAEKAPGPRTASRARLTSRNIPGARNVRHVEF